MKNKPEALIQLQTFQNCRDISKWKYFTVVCTDKNVNFFKANVKWTLQAFKNIFRATNACMVMMNLFVEMLLLRVKWRYKFLSSLTCKYRQVLNNIFTRWISKLYEKCIGNRTRTGEDFVLLQFLFSLVRIVGKAKAVARPIIYSCVCVCPCVWILEHFSTHIQNTNVLQTWICRSDT